MIDLHCHTTASDGQHPAAEVVARAKAAGITRLAITDHDTVAAIEGATAAARALGGIEIVAGIEISTSILGRDIHILGHFVDPEDPGIRALEAEQLRERRARMVRMIEKLAALSISVRLEEVEAVAGGETLCRPHLARVLVAKGICRDLGQAFRWYLGDGAAAHSEHRRPSAAEAISIIRGAGGAATLAHPASDDVDRARIAALAELGLAGLEVDHSEATPPARARYREVAEALDLVATAGSDFHGEAVSPRALFGRVALDPSAFDRLAARAGSAQR